MSDRAKNRSDFPICTEMFDMIRETHPEARILWASENGREIGKKPTPDPGTFEISAETYTYAMERLAERNNTRRRK